MDWGDLRRAELFAALPPLAAFRFALGAGVELVAFPPFAVRVAVPGFWFWFRLWFRLWFPLLDPVFIVLVALAPFPPLRLLTPGRGRMMRPPAVLNPLLRRSGSDTILRFSRPLTLFAFSRPRCSRTGARAGMGYCAASGADTALRFSRPLASSAFIGRFEGSTVGAMRFARGGTRGTTSPSRTTYQASGMGWKVTSSNGAPVCGSLATR